MIIKLVLKSIFKICIMLVIDFYYVTVCRENELPKYALGAFKTILIMANAAVLFSILRLIIYNIRKKRN